MHPKFKEKLNQSGLTHLLILGIMILFSMLGFVAWRISHENSVRNKKNTTTKTKPINKFDDPEVKIVPRSKQKFSKQTVDYFDEIALGSEYGDSGPLVAKWEKSSVTIKVNGTPSANDAICLDQVINDFNAISTETKLSITNTNSDSDIYFVPEPQFKNILSSYVPVNMGYFTVNWSKPRSINKSTILISTTGLSDVERCHLIREETTQSMGLMKDSHSYPDSMFYDDWTYTTAYSELDKQLIKLLYGGNNLKPNDDKATVDSKITIN